MKKPNCLHRIQHHLVSGASVLMLLLAGASSVWGYESYSPGCSTCHGDFRGPVSPKVPPTSFAAGNKHDMHRGASYMDAECNLCHYGSSRSPVYTWQSNGTANNAGVGCTGCHEPLGLRKHHLVNGIAECQDCHTDDGPPPPEGTKPPYYGTPDTKAQNPGNTVLAHYTNENWSGSDFLGLDNDGNNLYDLADYAVGPYSILSAGPQGSDFVVRWVTAGGRTNTVQRAPSLSMPFADVSAAIEIPGVGLATNTFVDVGGATNSMRFYRLKAVVP